MGHRPAIALAQAQQLSNCDGDRVQVRALMGRQGLVQARSNLRDVSAKELCALDHLPSQKRNSVITQLHGPWMKSVSKS